jgi:hypothetical protein
MTEMKMHSWLAIVHFGTGVNKETYMVDRGAYYLLCQMQKVKNFGDFPEELTANRTEMFKIVLDWLVDVGRAFKTSKEIHHLIIKLGEKI